MGEDLLSVDLGKTFQRRRHLSRALKAEQELAMSRDEERGL